MTPARGCLVPWSRGLSSTRKLLSDQNRLLVFWLLCFLEQPHQLILPESRNGVTAVTAGFVAQRNQHRAALWHPFDLALEDPELRGIDQIVGGIDRQEWGANFFQVRTGIIIV